VPPVHAAEALNLPGVEGVGPDFLKVDFDVVGRGKHALGGAFLPGTRFLDDSERLESLLPHSANICGLDVCLKKRCHIGSHRPEPFLWQFYRLATEHAELRLQAKAKLV